MMTRKHYTEVAEILRTAHENATISGSHDAHLAVYRITEAIARLFTKDNPRFDRVRFTSAVRHAPPSPFAAFYAEGER